MAEHIPPPTTEGFPVRITFTPRGLASLWCQRYGYNASADEIQRLLDLLVPMERHDQPVQVKEPE